MGLRLPMRTHLRIDLDQIAANFRGLRDAVGPEVHVVAAVKANAYGHGAAPVTLRLEAEGCEHFAVATLDEAVELREAGVGTRILLLYGFLPGEESEVARRGITPVLTTVEMIERWGAAASNYDRPLPCHMKFNTGMSRAGLDDRSPDAIAAAAAPEIEVEGLCTHLSSAEDFEEAATEQQTARFELVIERLAEKGVRPGVIHMANSAAIAWRPSLRFNMVRSGLALYGYQPRPIGASGDPSYRCQPALEWRAKILDIRDVLAGDKIGYNGTFTAQQPMRVALLGVGYGDGFRRELSNNADVLVRGSRCPVVGRVSMDLTTVDATSLAEVRIGDEATLLGGGLGLHELADRCGTVSYEILCGISSRVKRVYTVSS